MSRERRRFAGGDRVPAFRPTPRVVWSLFGETFSEWNTDRAPRLGAALAFYTVFALAPGLLLITALAGVLLGRDAAQAQIIGQVEELVGHVRGWLRSASFSPAACRCRRA